MSRVEEKVDDPMILRAMDKGKFIRVNDSFTAKTGFDAAELAGKHFLDWIAPCDRTIVQAALENNERSFFARHITRDGNALPLEIQVAEHEAGLFVLGRCAKASTQLESDAARSAAEATVLGTLDAIARIIEEQNTGYKCSILLVAEGRFVFGAGPSLPEEYNSAVNGYAIGPTVGSCGTAIFWNTPVIVADIQADPLWAPLAALAKKAGVAACWSHPFVSSSGKVLGALALYSPEPRAPTPEQLSRLKAAARITGLAVERGRAEEELKRADEAIKAARNQLQATLNALPDLLFEVDSEGRIFSYHSPPSDLLPAQPEVFLNKRFADILPQEAADVCQRAIDEAAHNGFSYGETYRLDLPQGEHWFELSVAPLHVDDQSDPRFIMISRDITDRKLAEIALHDAERNAQYQLTFHRIAAETAAALTTSTSDAEFDTGINQCLQRLGLLFGVDRSYVFQFSDDFAYTTNTHEWCADGIVPEMDNLKNFRIDDNSWLTTRLIRDGMFYARVADLPPEAATLKAELQREEIQSFLNATTRGAHGKLAGFIGFDSVLKVRSWRDDELDMIQTIAGVVGSLSVSKRSEKKLRASHKELQAKNTLLNSLSKSDQLTGIANRRRTQQVIEQEIDRFNRYKKPFCLFLFDVDHFKAVNDNHGHEVGDQVLVELVGLVQSEIRRTDTLGRWGGEEFVLVCPETSLPTAQTIAEKICTTVRDYEFTRGLGITLSIGVSEFQSGATSKEILVEVDRKMYLAKQKGRDRVES